VTEHGIRDRVVIVTGAGRGIGRGIAHHIGRNGASVALVEFRASRLARVAGELEALGVPNLGVECDVSDRDAVFAMVDRVLERFGRVDGLVNNAQAMCPYMDLDQVRPEHLDVVMDSGPRGTLWCMQAVYPPMRGQGSGRIVNFASGAGISGAAGLGPYNAAKEAIRALTRTAAREWGRYGISVNCVCPASAGHRRPLEEGASPHRKAIFDRHGEHPMRRDGDAEDDIAPAVQFLLSDASRFLTGETLKVDGGALLTA
jgi:NAD(P)-dependent dehydrogenase (short-subunit alcohol dehydrogenase family)